MPRKLYEFIQRPENRNLTLKQLPKRVQTYINAKRCILCVVIIKQLQYTKLVVFFRRDVVRIYELLVLLEDMKLAVIHQPTGQLIKINVCLHIIFSFTPNNAHYRLK